MAANAFRSVRMDWRVKSRAFRLFDVAPGGRQAYYLTQRYVTKTLPRPMTPTAETASWFLVHADAIRRQTGGELGAARLFEFGAGWDLYSNLTLWCLGVEHQLVVDLNRWLKPWAIDAVAAHLRADPPAGAVRVPEHAVDPGALEASLLQHYGIDYRAPADARALAVSAGGVDVVATTSVLEHIPPASLTEILTESHRVCHAGSLASHVIDYSDHYAHSDAGITPYNFLTFTPEQWRRHNPDIHFQNRLRHADYRALFAETGWEVLEEEVVVPPDAEPTLAGLTLAAPYDALPVAEVAPTTGRFLLARAG